MLLPETASKDYSTPDFSLWATAAHFRLAEVPASKEAWNTNGRYSLPSHASSGCKDAVLEGIGEVLFRALTLVSRDASKKRENLLHVQSPPSQGSR